MIRSPFFYVGDKYKLVPQLLEMFPDNINKYIEPFAGGGSSAMRIHSNQIILNDIDENIIFLHKFLYSYKDNESAFFKKIFFYINKYNLSCSFKENIIPNILKKEFPKTYYSKFNKVGYLKMREDYNKRKNPFLLYLLLIYGFNHMIRFNSAGKFNLPIGNIDYNQRVHRALLNYFDFCRQNDIIYQNKDFKSFIYSMNIDNNSFIYLDPPYLISSSEYNKLWNINNENELYSMLDDLNEKGIKFGITNLLIHKGNTNNIFENWSKKYKSKCIYSNYISFNDNTIKRESKEIYVYNY